MRGSWFVLCAVAVGCGSLPRPRLVSPPNDAYEAVPYPPPAALSELVPEEPEGKDVVWIDGSWVFRGNFYVWQRGGWVENPRDAAFADWKVRWTPDGRVEYAASSWRDTAGKRKRAQILKPAGSPSNEVTAEFQAGR
jgi:hypothetical protein